MCLYSGECARIVSDCDCNMFQNESQGEQKKGKKSLQSLDAAQKTESFSEGQRPPDVGLVPGFTLGHRQTGCKETLPLI